MRVEPDKTIKMPKDYVFAQMACPDGVVQLIKTHTVINSVNKERGNRNFSKWRSKQWVCVTQKGTITFAGLDCGRGGVFLGKFKQTGGPVQLEPFALRKRENDRCPF